MKDILKRRVSVLCCIFLLMGESSPIFATTSQSIGINQQVESSEENSRDENKKQNKTDIEDNTDTKDNADTKDNIDKSQAIDKVIHGIDDIEIEQGSEFDPKSGVYIIDSDGNKVNDNIIISGTVDTSKEGIYTLKYTYKDGDKVISESNRIVKVISSASTEETDVIFEGIRNSTIKLEEKIDLLDGVRAFDKNNEDITESISVSGNVDTKKEGEYIVKYSIDLGEGKKVEKDRKIVVVNSKSIINVFTDEEDVKNKQLAFSIVFDEEEKKLKFVNITDKEISSKEIKDTIFNMKVLSKDGIEKLNIDIKGNEKIEINKDEENIQGIKESKNVELLEDFVYEDGDYIQILTKDLKEGFNIWGDIKGEVDKTKEDYSDGVDSEDYIKNVRFKITSGALETVYNNAPEIHGLTEMSSMIKNRADQLKDISVTDDHDGTISNEKIKIEKEKKDGKIIGLRYTVSDSWGRTSSYLRTLSSEKELTSNDNEEKTKNQSGNLASNVIEVHGIDYYDEDSLRFKIGFDIVNKKFTIDQDDTRLFDNKIKDKYFELVLYDANSAEKDRLTLNGNEKADNKKIEEFVNRATFEYGDQIELYHYYSKDKLKITGTINKIINGENYADGASPEELEDVRFKLTQTGLEVLKNKAPQINGLTELHEQVGKDINLLNGVTVTDDIDINIPVSRVKVSKYDKNLLGTQTITYTVEDSWGKVATAERKIILSNNTSLSKTSIDIMDMTAAEKLFSIKFDDINKKLYIDDKNEGQLDSSKPNETVLTIQIYNRTGVLRKSVELKGNDTASSKELLEVIGKYNYKIGDSIAIKANNHKSIKITGDIKKDDELQNIDYSNSVSDAKYINDVRFEINESQLFAKYNNAPDIIFNEENQEISIKRGEKFNPLDFVNKVQDDHDIIGKDLIRAEYDKEKIKEVGKYTVTYTVKDSWGKVTKEEKTLNVDYKNDLEAGTISLLKKEKAPQPKVDKSSTNNSILTLRFDDIEKKLKVEVEKGKYIEGNSNEIAFSITVFNSKGEEKAKSEINFNQSLDEYTLKNVTDIDIQYDDYINVKAYRDDAISMKYKSLGIEYEDGFVSTDEMVNTRFKISENGLEAIYNQAPKFIGLEQEISVQKIAIPKFNYFTGITVQDDHDDNIGNDKIRIKGRLDSSVSGYQTIQYSVTDSWGRTTQVERRIYVIPLVENNSIQLTDDSGQQIFEIKFDLKKSGLVVTKDVNYQTDSKNSTNEGDSDKTQEPIFYIDIRDADRNEVVNVKLLGTDEKELEKLKALENKELPRELYIYLWSKTPNNLKITGEIIKPENITEDYSDGIDDEDFMKNVAFKVNEEGVTAIYNEAPTIELKNISRSKGSIDVSKGVKVNFEDYIEYYDDKDSKDNLTLDITEPNVDQVGSDTVTYTVKDTWGRITSEKVRVQVLNGLLRHTLRFESVEEIDVEKYRIYELFSMKFDISTKKFIVTKGTDWPADSEKVHPTYGVGNYYVISVLRNDNTEKHKLEIKGDMKLSDARNKIKEIESWDFEYGDKIKITAGQNPRFSIKGDVIDALTDYSKGVPLSDYLNYVKFDITDSGLVSIYEDNSTSNNEAIFIYNQGGNYGLGLKYNPSTKKLENLDSTGRIGYNLSKPQETETSRIIIRDKDRNIIESLSLLRKDNKYDLSTKLKDITNHVFTDGDTVEFYIDTKENTSVKNFIIKGNVFGKREDYLDGTDNEDNMLHTKFEFGSFHDEDGTEYHVKAVYNDAPEINGADDVDVIVGDKNFNLADGIQVTDDHDGKEINKTLQIQPKKQFDVNKVGVYTIEYIATDSEGRTTVKERKVNVRPKIYSNTIEFYANNKVNKVASEEKSSNNVSDTKKRAFEIKFDNTLNKYLVTNKENVILDQANPTAVVFEMSIYNKSGLLKGKVELLGIDRGTSSKLNKLDSIRYENGDYFRVKGLNGENIVLTGEIGGEVKKQEEDFNDGINNDEYLYNTAFKASYEGLKSIHNKAPEIKTDKINKTIYYGETYDLKDGIIVSDDKDSLKVEDLEINGSVNSEQPGTYEVEYTLTDSWGRSASAEVIFKVKSKLTQNTIEVYSGNNASAQKKFDIGFDMDTNKLTIDYNGVAKTANADFKIILRDKKMESIGELVISKNESHEDILRKINEFSQINLNVDYSLEFYSEEKSNIKIKGNIENSNENFDNGFPTNLDFDKVRFVLTHKGLRVLQYEKPKISFEKELVEIKRGDTSNVNDGLSIKYKDEYNSNAIKIQVKGYDPNIIGEYRAKYEITDGWGETYTQSRKIKVLPLNELEKNEITLLDSTNKKPLVKINFDTIENKIMTRFVSDTFSGAEDIELLNLKVYNAEGILQDSLVINSSDFSSEIEKRLAEIEYFEGYYVGISVYNPKRGITIGGTISEQKEDYTDGVDDKDHIENVRFRIDKENLTSVYNNAPIITVGKELTIFRNKEVDLYDGVNITDNDPHDIDKVGKDYIEIDTDLDISSIGKYEITYSAEDEWGRRGEATTYITVKSTLENNRIEFYPSQTTLPEVKSSEDVPGAKEPAFSIWIDNKRDYLNVDIKFSTLRKLLNEVKAEKVKTGEFKIFEVNLFDKDMQIKKSVNILSTDNALSAFIKLKKFDGTIFEYGDYIQVYAKDHESGIAIIGDIEKGVGVEEEYDDGIQDINNMEHVRFKLNEEALYAIYNNAPKIEVPVEELEGYAGDDINITDKVVVSDDFDLDISIRDIEISEEDKMKFQEIGENTITLTLSDSWGRTTTATRKINLKPSINRNSFDIQTQKSGTAFTVTFDHDTGKMNFKVNNGDTFTDIQSTEFMNFKHFSSDGSIKGKVDLNYEDNANSEKLEYLKNNPDFEYGDYFTVSGAVRYLRIHGVVRNGREDYSTGIKFADDFMNTKIYITEQGLKAVFEPTIAATEDKIILEYLGSNNNIPLLMEFDLKNEDIQVVGGKKDVDYLYNHDIDEDVFMITLYRSNGQVKKSIAVKNTKIPNRDNPDSPENRRVRGPDHFKGFNGEKIEDGDYLEFYSYAESKIRLYGDIEKSPGNLELGLNRDSERNAVYTFKKDSNGNLKMEYTYLAPPEIKGVNDITIKQGESFNVFTGVSATDRFGTDITRKITTSGEVYTDRVGVYEVSYTATDRFGRSTTVNRNISVYSEAIIKAKDTTQPTLEQCSIPNDKEAINKYLLSLVEAEDSDDGNLTDKIVVTETNLNPNTIGDYTVSYSVTNSFGKITKLEDFEVRVARTISVTVPTTVPFQVVTNLIDKGADPFIAAKLKLSNTKTTPVEVYLKKFERTEGNLDIVSKDAYPNWDDLSVEDSMSKMALGIYPDYGLDQSKEVNGEGQSIEITRDNPIWLSNSFTPSNPISLGVIERSPSLTETTDATLSFVSKHGKNFTSGSSKAKFKLEFEFR